MGFQAESEWPTLSFCLKTQLAKHLSSMGRDREVLGLTSTGSKDVTACCLGAFSGPGGNPDSKSLGLNMGGLDITLWERALASMGGMAATVPHCFSSLPLWWQIPEALLIPVHPLSTGVTAVL